MLFLLTVDHSDSLEHEVYKIPGHVTGAQTADIEHDNTLVFRGLEVAISGVAVARGARSAGIDLAMPVEKGDKRLLVPEYADG